MKFILLLSIACILAKCSLLDQRLDFTYNFANSNNSYLVDRVSRKLEDIVNFPKIRARELFARQETCSIPTDVLCPGGAYCCPAGDDCVSGGCCPSGEVPCGSSKCYNPGTEVCCSDGTRACYKGQDCVPGGCCTSGELLCGSSKCYNPDTEICCSDGSGACPKDEDCVSGGCCPSGQILCGNSNCYDPTISKCCTGSGKVWACKLPADCCASPNVCFEDGEQCCENGSCLVEDTCCANQCCTPIGFCGDDGWCTLKSSSTPTPTPIPTPTPTPTPTVTLSLTSAVSISPTSAPNFSTPKFSTPKLPSSSTSSTTSSSTTSSISLPTVIFPYIPNLTDDLVQNMCLGLRSQNAPKQSQVLTYGGNSASQRSKTGCKGGRCCSGQTKQSGSNAGMSLSCDEYPFASTNEGGSGAHVGCIVAWQNGLQGWYLSNFYRDYNLQPNDQFVMEITGIDCDTVKDTDIPGCNSFMKRDTGNVTAGSGSQLFQSNSSDQNALVIPFGDLTPGQYSTRVKVPPGSTISNLTILDNIGFLYASSGSLLSYTNLSTSGVDISWTLTDYEYGVSVIADTAETSLNATWQLAVNTTLPSTSVACGKGVGGLTSMLLAVAALVVFGTLMD